MSRHNTVLDLADLSDNGEMSDICFWFKSIQSKQIAYEVKIMRLRHPRK